MKIRFVLLLSGLTALPGMVLAQNQITQSQLSLTRLQTRTSMGLYNSIDQVSPDAHVVGTPYVDDNWQNAVIVLREGDRFSNVPIRYDIYSDILEIKVGDQVKGLEGSKAGGFSVVSNGSERRFMRASRFKADEPLAGFLEVLDSGKIELLKHYAVTVVKPDYSPQMNVGSRDYKVLHKHTFYYTTEGVTHEVPKQRKKLLAIFSDHQTEVSDFVRNEHIDLDEEAGLKRVFNFYNQLK